MMSKKPSKRVIRRKILWSIAGVVAVVLVWGLMVTIVLAARG